MIYSPFEYDSEALLVLDAKRQMQARQLSAEIHRLREQCADTAEGVEVACDTAYDEGKAHAFAEVSVQLGVMIGQSGVSDKWERRFGALATAHPSISKPIESTISIGSARRRCVDAKVCEQSCKDSEYCARMEQGSHAGFITVDELDEA